MSIDTVVRMALAAQLRADSALSPEERVSLEKALQSTAVFTPETRQRLTEQALQWLQISNARCAEVVRLSLAGDEDVPWRGHRSTEGILRVATIVERLQQEQDAMQESTPRRQRSSSRSLPSASRQA